MIDFETRENTRLASIGMDVERFMGTEGGRELTRRANAEILAAQVALLDVDPADQHAVRELQNKARVATMFLQWMGEMKTEGEQAEDNLQQADA